MELENDRYERRQKVGIHYILRRKNFEIKPNSFPAVAVPRKTRNEDRSAASVWPCLERVIALNSAGL